VDHSLAACEVSKSTFCNAGSRVYLLEAALQGQILFKYGGSRISFAEADRLAEMVRKIQNHTDYRSLLA